MGAVVARRDVGRAVQAVLILAGSVGLVTLGSVARVLWGARAEVPDGALILVGAAVLAVDAARRCLGEEEAPRTEARCWNRRQDRARQGPSRPGAASSEVAHGRRAA